MASLDLHRSMEGFGIELRPDRARVVVAPHGELDLATVPRLAEEIDVIVDVGFTELVLDLRALTFMDAAGLRLVIDQASRLDVTVCLIQGPPAVERVLDFADTSTPLPFLEPHELAARHY